MDIAIELFPAVLDFRCDVAPLLETVGIDIDTVMVPVVIGPSFVQYQYLETTDGGDRIAEDIAICDGASIVVGIGVRLPTDVFGSIIARFDAYGSMKVEIGDTVVSETLVVYPSQP